MAISDDILDRAVRHAILMERFKTRTVGEILTFLNNEMLPDLEAQLVTRLAKIKTRGFDASPWKTRKFRNLILGIRRLMKASIKEASDTVAAAMGETALSEAEWIKSIIKSESGPLALELTLPSARQLQAIATSSPFRGRLLKKWFDDLSEGAQRTIESELKIGLAEGESTASLVSRIRGTGPGAEGVFGTIRRQTEATVRTAVNHTVTQARELTYAANSDVIKAVRYVATLDNRTTLICASLDGNVTPINDGPRPPQHMNCRSTTIPIMKSFEELGIPLNEIPPGSRVQVSENFDGQVPSDLNYPQWLRGQSTKIQNEVLGATRGRLFRANKVTIERFVDRRNQPLTLDQIRRREGLTAAEVSV